MAIFTGLGSAAAPSITFSADTNTGIFSPGADQISISTSGLERMRITPSGEVGIGTISPGTALDVRFPTNPSTNNGGGFNTLRCWTSSALAADSGGAISLGGTVVTTGEGASFGQIAGRKDNATSASYGGYLQFATNDAGGTMGERMRIDSSGNVGIGTASPTAKLEVVSIPIAVSQSAVSARFGTGDNTYDFRIENNTDGSGNPFVVLKGPDGGLPYTSFVQGNVERLRIDSSGRIGLGTNDPNSNGLVTIFENTYARLFLADNTLGNTFGAQLRGYSLTGLGGQAELGVVDNNIFSKAIHILEQANGIIFSNGANERARIDGIGRLLIGTSTPRSNFSNESITSIFQVEGLSNNFARYISHTYNANDSGSPVYILAKSRGTALNSSTVVQVDDVLGEFRFEGADGTNFVRGANILVQVDGTPGANDMPGRMVFSTTADGSASPTERMRIDREGFVRITGSIGRGAPVTKTANFSPGVAENWIICNGTGTITVTLPTAADWTGREIMLKTIAGFAVISASSNVVPLAGGAAGAAILAATSGKYATLVSDGTNWIIMEAN